MTAAGKSHLLTVLNYPGAGHLIEPPYSPHCAVARMDKKSTSCSVRPRESSAFPFVNAWRTHGGVCAFVLVVLVHGGETKPHSDAQEDAWWKILAYLRHHLYSTPWDCMVKSSATNHLSSSSPTVTFTSAHVLKHGSRRIQQRYGAQLLKVTIMYFFHVIHFHALKYVHLNVF